MVLQLGSAQSLLPVLFKKAPAVLLFFLYSFCAYCQVTDPNFDHFTVKEGLPSEQIYNCVQDKEGYLWIGTDAGVSRYDGKAFKNYNIDNGLGDSEIHEVYQDALGRIWFIPFSGKLTYYFKGTIYQQNIDKLMEEPSSNISNHFLMAEDGRENLYITKIGSSRIMKLTGINAKPEFYNLTGLLEQGERLLEFYGTSQGQVYCLSDYNHLFLLGNSFVKNVTPPQFLAEEQPSRFYANHLLSSGYVLFSGAKGLYIMRDFKISLLIPTEKLPSASKSNFILIKFDQHNNLWLNDLHSSTIFYKFSKGGYERPMLLLKNMFSITTCDHENNIWFSTANGLYRLNYDKLRDKTGFNINQHLLARKVISCLTDKDSGLWLGYSNGYISRIKDTNVIHYNLKRPQRINNRIVQMRTDSAGNILIGSDETVAIIRRINPGIYGRVTQFRNEDGSELRCYTKNIFFNRKGKAFVSDPFSSQLLQLNIKTGKVRRKNLNNNNARRFISFFDKDDRLYTSTIQGFNVLENGVSTNLARQNDRFNVRMQDYAENAEGIIFLATYNNGLIAMKDKKCLSVMPRISNQALICRRLYLKNDTLYAATNYGLAILIFSDQQFKLIKLIGGLDGLVSSDVYDLTFLGNKLFIATSHGISVFGTKLRPETKSPAPVLILKSVQVDDKLYSVKEQLELSHKTKHIRINFIAPVLDKPELVRYRYRFGSSESWQTTSSDFIEFSKLKPGTYNIMIQAKKYNSDWGLPCRIDFVLSPPVYSTLWFIVFVVLVLGIGLFFMIRSFLRKKFREQLYVLQQKQAIEKERIRIAANIHDDLGAELTNITILSRILKYDAWSNQDQSARILNKLESSSSQLISKMNDVIWTLNTRNHTFNNLATHIRNYVNSLNETADTGIRVVIEDSVQADRPLMAELAVNVFLIAKELLQNAIKHAQAEEIRIIMALSDKDTALLLKYSDNGIGFDSNKEYRGNGLYNIRRRVKESGGTIDIFSQPQKGCRITIVFPLR